MTEETLFAEAIELPPEERAAFLDEKCGEDADLRERVEILLRSHDMAESFLARPAGEDFDATLDVSADDQALIEARSAELRKSQAAKVDQNPDEDEPPTVNIVVEPDGKRVMYFGDYELQGEIARGAMGVVYRAEQKSLKRTVAIKMIRSTLLANDTDVTRFLAEAEAAASLDHPNIVPIYEVGEHAEQHYFSMKLIEGGTLRDHLERLQGDPKAAATLMSTVAGAIHVAHQRGILHRDLKPGNILVDEQGEPHVTDFGLAKQMESNSSVTLSGQIMGTPQYMAPEQAEGGGNELTTAADVYALGAIFYEMLCGKPPHQGASLMETLKWVVEEEAVAPSRHHPKIDRDLETIAMKCLNKDPAGRYASAQGLKNDLDYWLRGEPILARPVGTAEKVIKWMKRKPMHAAAAVFGVLFLTTLGIGGPMAALRQAELRGQAEVAEGLASQRATQAEDARIAEAAAKEEALKAEAETRRRLYASEVTAALIALDSPFGQKRARSALDQWDGATEGEDLRGWEWYFAASQIPPAPAISTGRSTRLPCWSPDGRQIAASTRTADSYSMRISDRDSGGVVKQGIDSFLGKTIMFRDAAWSPDGAFVAQTTGNIGLWIWDAGTARLHQQFEHQGARFLSWSPDGRLLAFQSSNSVIHLWDKASPRGTTKLWRLPNDGDAVEALQWSSDGVRLLVATRQGRIFECLPRTGQGSLLHQLEMEGVRWRWSGDGRFLACISEAPHKIFVWDKDELQKAPVTIDCSVYFRAYPHSQRVLDFSPDNRFIAVASWSRNVTVWNLKTGQLVKVHASDGPVKAVRWSPDGTRLLTQRHQASVFTQWNPFPDRQLRITGVSRFDWAEDGLSLVTLGDEKIMVRDGLTGDLRRTIVNAEEVEWVDVKTRPGHEHFAALDIDGGVTIYGLKTGKQIHSRHLLPAGPRKPGLAGSGAINPDSRLCWGPQGKVLGAATGGWLRLWDVETKQEVFTVAETDWRDSYKNAVVHPNGDIVAAKAFGDLRVWNFRTGEMLFENRESLSNRCPLAWSPDGTRLASAGFSRIKIFELDSADGKTITRGQFWDSPGAEVNGLFWSDDSKRLFTTSDDQVLRVWEPESATELQAIHDVIAAGLDPLGLRIAALGKDGLRILDASPAYEWSGSDKALPLLDARIERNPASMADLESRVRIFIENSRWKEAARDLASLEELHRQAVAGDPDARVALHRQSMFRRKTAGLYASKGRWEEVCELLGKDEAAGKLLPHTILVEREADFVLHALALAETGRIDEANAAWRRSQEYSSSENAGDGDLESAEIPRPWERLIRGEASRLEMANAKDLAWEKLALEPHDAIVLGTLGLAHYRNGEYEEATRSLRRSAATLGSPSPWINGFLAMALHGEGRHDEAMEAYRQAGASFGEAIDTWSGSFPKVKCPECGEYHRNPEEFPEQLSRITTRVRAETLLVLNGVESGSLPARALALAEEGDYDRALDLFLEALAGAHSDESIEESARRALAYEGIFVALRERCPQHEEVFTRVQAAMVVDEIHSLLDGDDLEGVMRSLRQLRELDPEHKVLDELDARVLADSQRKRIQAIGRKEWNQASALSRKIAELDPETSLEWLRHGAILASAGVLDDYRSLVAKILERTRDTDDVEESERATKVGLLIPGVFATSDLPRAAFEEALDTGNAPSRAFERWATATRSLFSYRSGRPGDALTFARLALEPNAPEQCSALAFTLVGLASAELGQAADARDALESAAALIDLALGGDEVPDSWHDWLIADTLRREAEQVLAEMEEAK